MTKHIYITILSLLCTLSAFATDYGILVNSKTYYNATYKGKDQYTGTYDEYLAHVPVKKGDLLQLCQPFNTDARWAVALDKSSVSGFTYDNENERYLSNVEGCYDFYIKLKYGEDQLYIGNGSGCGAGQDYETMYKGSVPPRCEAVLMQAFYNDSYRDDAPGVSEYGDTRWATLFPQAAEIGKYIDYVWLPPSSYGDGMGYHPKQYSNQNSNWGTREELEALISALHNAGSKVVADIVINHCAGWTTWCDFPEFDFGEFGKFHPDVSYIAQTDEMNLDPNAGECYGKATGNNDDGWGDWYGNWNGARDWAHDMPKVQEMFKAYLRWMRKVMKYDGFRYDKGDGFNNWHHDNYNRAAQPEIAFMESYTGTDKIKAQIDQAEKNLMALDFGTRWDAFDKIAGFNYSGCKGSGLLGAGYAHYAVTFIDSHDWFLRPDNNNEFGGPGKSMTQELKDRLLQANAFMLGMPGVPCVFYPHWKKYKDAIKPMIEARKLAGVHSWSDVSDEYADENGYQCTVKGRYGWLILMLGSKTTHEQQDWLKDYKLVAKGNGYAMWVNRTAPLPTGVDEVADNKHNTEDGHKFLRDGQLFIEKNGITYDILGNRVRP